MTAALDTRVRPHYWSPTKWGSDLDAPLLGKARDCRCRSCSQPGVTPCRAEGHGSKEAYRQHGCHCAHVIEAMRAQWRRDTALRGPRPGAAGRRPHTSIPGRLPASAGMDEAVIVQACTGADTIEPNAACRVEAVRRLAAAGLKDWQIGQRLWWYRHNPNAANTVARFRARWGIPAAFPRPTIPSPRTEAP